MDHTLPETSSPRASAADKRRSTRVAKAVPILVRGTDALKNEFKESTTTVSVNCSGCQYQSKHYVQKNSAVTIEITHSGLKLSQRIIPSRVVWVQRPRTYRHLFLVSVEFTIHGNVWGIQSPPGDWFQHPEDEELQIPAYEQPSAPKSRDHAGPAPTPTLELKADPEPVREIVPATSSKTVEGAVESAVAKELERMRGQIDAQFQAAIERAAEALVERVTKAAVENVLQQTVEGISTAQESGSINSLSGKRRRRAHKQKV